MNREILLVDFDATALEHWQSLLVEKGYSVCCATTAAAVGKLLDKASRPALVVLEPMLPGLDGFTLCRSLKDPSKGTPPVVVIASRIFRGQRYRGIARDAGADLFLEKPIDDDKFLSTIASYVEPDLDAARKAQAAAARAARGVEIPAAASVAPPAAPRVDATHPPSPPPWSGARGTTAAASLGMGWEEDVELTLDAVTDDELDDVFGRLAMHGDTATGTATKPDAPLSMDDVVSALDRLELTNDGDGSSQDALHDRQIATDTPADVPAPDGHSDGREAPPDSEEDVADDAEQPEEAKDTVVAAPPPDVGDGPFFDRPKAAPHEEASTTSSAAAAYGDRSGYTTAIAIQEIRPEAVESSVPVTVTAERDREAPALDLDALDESLDDAFEGLNTGTVAPERPSADTSGETAATESAGVEHADAERPASLPNESETTVAIDVERATGAFTSVSVPVERAGHELADASSEDFSGSLSGEIEARTASDDAGASSDDARERLAGMDPGTAELLSSLEELQSSFPRDGVVGPPTEQVRTREEPPTAEEEETLSSVFDAVPAIERTPVRKVEILETRSEAPAEPAEEPVRDVEAEDPAELVLEAGPREELASDPSDAYYEQLLEHAGRSRGGLWIAVVGALVVVGGAAAGAAWFTSSDAESPPSVARERAPEPDVAAAGEDPTALRPVPSLGESGPDPAAPLGASPAGTDDAIRAAQASQPVATDRPRSTETTEPRTSSAPVAEAARETASARTPSASETSPAPAEVSDEPGNIGTATADAIPVVKLAELDRPLQLIEFERPAPTEAALAAGVAGRVFLQVLVGPDGRVRDSRVMMEPGFGLGRLAQESVTTWRYNPPSKNLEKVRVWKTEVVEFGEGG